MIPFLGDTQRLEETLVSVLENRPPDSEVLVVLCQPYSNPYHLEDEVRFVPGPSRPGWASALNHGTAAARAPWIHVLCCGAAVEEGWAEPALAHFHDGTVAAVAPVVTEAASPERVSAGMYYDPRGAIGPGKLTATSPCPPSLRFPVAPHWAAAFYRKSAWEAAGPFAEDLGDRLAMLDFGLTLAALGLRTVVEPHCVVRVPAEATPPSAFRRACDAERFYWRWAGVYGRRNLGAHARHVAADCLAGLADLSFLARVAGRLVGLAGWRAARRQRRRLEHLQQVYRPAHDAGPMPRLLAVRSNGSAGSAPHLRPSPANRPLRSAR